MTYLGLVGAAAAIVALSVVAGAQSAPPPSAGDRAPVPATTPTTATTGPVQFDSASIKRNRSNSNIVGVSGGRGQYQGTNITVGLLLAAAFRMPSSQIIGAPEWTETERYDVVAKMPDGVSQAPGVAQTAQQEAIRALLEDRFKMMAHKETRELPIFALVVAREGRLGPDLTPSKNDCTPGARRGAPAGGGPPGAPQFGRGARPTCGTMAGPGLISAGGITMTRLVELLSGTVGRPVVDRTGLNGFYDLDLIYLPDQPPTGPLPAGVQLPFTPDSPSLQTAIQEQLGLKLDSARGQVDVTVIDRLERPTEN
jgi:uncharacterized protein (TIGR03435 family)